MPSRRMRQARITHGIPPCGAADTFAFFPFGLNFAICCDGSTRVPRPCKNRTRMTRRNCMWPALALAFGACQSRPALPADLFPETADGGWRRTWAGDVPDSRDPVPRGAVNASRAAAYNGPSTSQGPGTLDVRVYRLSSPAVGTDLAQRWRPSADTVFFNQGVYFVVVKWQSADRQALEAFVRQMERKLGAARR